MAEKLKVNLENARTPEQTAHMQDMAKQNKCGFCDINRELNPVDLYVNKDWIVWENAWPYPGHAYHLVLPSVKHLTKLSEIDDKVARSAHDAIMWAIKKLSIKGGCVVLRFGEFLHHAGTYAHMHFQVQVGNLLSQSFVTMGRPDATQVEEAVSMLMGTYTFRYSFIKNDETKYWQISKIENKRPYTLHQFTLDPRENFNIRDKAGFVDLIRTVRQLEQTYTLPGGALVLRFGDDKFHGLEFKKLAADVVVADGTGPVFEVLHPAANELQAMRSMKALVKK